MPVQGPVVGSAKIKENVGEECSRDLVSGKHIWYSLFWVIPPASEIYVPIFRNTMFRLHMWCK